MRRTHMIYLVLEESSHFPFHSQSHIDPCDAFKFRLYPAVMSLSCICLALTIGVYSALPELRNLPGKNVVCLSASLLLAFACLSGEMRVRERGNKGTEHKNVQP